MIDPDAIHMARPKPHISGPYLEELERRRGGRQTDQYQDPRTLTPGAGFTPEEAERVLDPDEALLDIPERLNLPRGVPQLRKGQRELPGQEEYLPREIQRAGRRGLLSDQEVARLGPRAVREFVDSFNTSTPVGTLERAAEFGRAGAAWYGRTARMITHLFGGEGVGLTALLAALDLGRPEPRFAASLAATSPKTPPVTNLRHALRYWVAYQKLLAQRAARGQRPPSQEELQHIIESQWARKYRNQGKRVPAFAAFYGLMAHALTSANPESNDYGVLRGATGDVAPKTDSFRQNTWKKLWAVTNDLWQSALGNYRQEDIDRLGGAYLAQAVKIRLAAAHRNHELPKGSKITPADCQACTWTAIRSLAFVAGRDDIHDTDPRTVWKLLGKVTGGNQMSSKDYLRGLQSDPVCHALLRQLGLDRGLLAALNYADQEDQEQAQLAGQHPLEDMDRTGRAGRQLLEVGRRGISMGGSFAEPGKRAQYARRPRQVGSLGREVLRAALLTQANRKARPLLRRHSTEALVAATRIGLEAIAEALDVQDRPRGA